MLEDMFKIMTNLPSDHALASEEQKTYLIVIYDYSVVIFYTE